MKQLQITTLLLLIALMGYSQEYEFNKKNVQVVDMKAKKMADAPKKVFLKSFKIYYQMIAEAEKTVYGGRQLGGGSYTGDATARLAVGVEGIAPEDLQAMTNDIYNDYVSKLEGMGFEVYTSDNIGDIEFFEGWEKVSGPTINEEQLKGSLMVIPEGFSYMVKRITNSGKEKTGAFMSGVTGNDGSFSSSAYGPNPKISKELGDMCVVEIALNVPSIYLDAKSQLGTAKVKGGAYLRLHNAKASYIQGKGNKPGVAYPDAAVETLLTKPVQINGVFESQEFKSVANKSRTTVPSYASFFTVEDKTVALSNTIECDASVYQAEVKKPIIEFLDMSLDMVRKGMQGEKAKF
ncbi:hypothetical protein [Marinoscillum sp.]|uniref:hypothetical protein n=1 Tax=Marinoscillum sp. TaxID=2024838 RepID=UPI003BA8F4E4